MKNAWVLTLPLLAACYNDPSNVFVALECHDSDVRDCESGCGPGRQTCKDGYWGLCIPDDDTELPDEVCDGDDNDCDGAIDEGCECLSGATRWCDGGEGACATGIQECDDNGYWGPCVPDEEGEPESCDGLDNDCDGAADEDFGMDEPCDPTGKCPQVRVCADNGESSTCIDDEASFAEEQCDGIDNDCDGLIDRVAENGRLRSICDCEGQTLIIGSSSDASIRNNPNLCATTRCAGDKPRTLQVDGDCYDVCETESDPDGDGWGFENGVSCLIPGSDRALAAQPCPGEGIPIGMAITYCLDCSGAGALPYAMCESEPRYDLTAFGRGEVWFNVDYTYTAAGPAGVPVNLWIIAEGGRKRLPLVRIGDLPGRRQTQLRIEDACFTASSAFGAECESDVVCSHCGEDETCGAIAECGDYDLSQGWLQVAAEFCERGTGEQVGTVTIHEVELAEPNCAE